MKYTYEVITTLDNYEVILRSDGATIPQNEANSDYQAYLRWLENPDADEAQSL